MHIPNERVKIFDSILALISAQRFGLTCNSGLNLAFHPCYGSKYAVHPTFLLAFTSPTLIKEKDLNIAKMKSQFLLKSLILGRIYVGTVQKAWYFGGWIQEKLKLTGSKGYVSC
jgi:hypothetical protein